VGQSVVSIHTQRCLVLLERCTVETAVYSANCMLPVDHLCLVWLRLVWCMLGMGCSQPTADKPHPASASASRAPQSSRALQPASSAWSSTTCHPACRATPHNRVVRAVEQNTNCKHWMSLSHR
jgi:hypothetical protein